MIGYDNSLFKRQYTLRFYYALLQHQCTFRYIYCLCHPDTENNNKSYVGTVHNEFQSTHEFFHEHLSNLTFIQYYVNSEPWKQIWTKFTNDYEIPKKKRYLVDKTFELWRWALWLWPRVLGAVSCPFLRIPANSNNYSGNVFAKHSNITGMTPIILEEESDPFPSLVS